MVQFLQINIFPGILQFLLGFLKVPVFCVTLYILTPERISQRHVQNGRRATFSWPTLYLLLILSSVSLCNRTTVLYNRHTHYTPKYSDVNACTPNNRQQQRNIIQLSDLLHREVYESTNGRPRASVCHVVMRSWQCLKALF